MLEQIIIRKSFLKKHLAAPLLKEREYFLTMKENLCCQLHIEKENCVILSIRLI